MKLKRTHLFMLGCVLAVVASLGLAGRPSFAAGGSGAAPVLDPAAIDAFVQAQVKNNHLPGFAIAVVKDGEVVMLRGYGEAGTGKPVTPQTQFYLGSTTKGFTAMAAMQLVEQGKLDLDAPVQRYLPWFQVADPAASGQITVRHLLNHTSGLSEDSDPNENAFTASLEEQARLLRYVRPNAAPGTKFQYFNQNYRVLGLLIEQASGQGYGAYLRQHVFAPLGMTSTVTDPADATNLSQGYGQIFGRPVPRPQRYIPGAVPSGYAITDAQDMARYMIAMLDGTRAGDQTLVKPETLALMTTPPAGLDSQYGMGWMVLDDPTLGRLWAHGGAVDNFQSFVLLIPGARVGLAWLGNQGGLLPMYGVYSSIRDGILALLAGRPASQGTIFWPIVIVGVLAALDLWLGLFRLFRVKIWARRIERRSRAVQWLAALADLAIAPLVVFGLPALAGAVLGGKGGWGDVYSILPDVALWVLTGCAITFARGLAKVTLVARRAA